MERDEKIDCSFDEFVARWGVDGDILRKKRYQYNP